MDRIIVKAR